ncbi:ferrochelatase [Hazenella sp. IB182357]|uniref:Coproporphyrin III ferrochelatase n=1 Tax=Polycladospora coralii TaxID=2771432 RepID=A0A926N958_9BACL|nr:ferrochelatase [Polycladospora coralii]MBD1372023.1 ferrochelatase [Polycladospora coralii]MBS7530529.1 ferrochelatase [Polycladospora coralii]
MTKPKVGLLVMAYGTPRKPEEIEPYYTHIRRGKKPPTELLDDLKHRYEMIGGISPLARITEEQQKALEQSLNDRFPQLQFQSYLGLKHIDPFIEDAVQQMHNDGIEHAISLVLAPHYSTFSVKSYNGRAQEAAKQTGNLTIHTIDSWHDHPKFIQYWVEKLKHTFSTIPAVDQDKAVVIFSAHSLPEKILQTGDPYPEQLAESARLIAEQAGITQYAIGWQSAGNTPEPWIGPDVQDLTRNLYHDKGYTSFIYCPIGFISNHLEVLYDNDYECKVVTDELGAHYYRPDMPNTNPLFIEALTDIVANRLTESFEGLK